MRARWRWLLPACGLLAAVLAPAPVAAERFVLAIGSNVGDEDEEVLRWAEEDARKTHTLLTELGDVRKENSRLVLGGSPAAVRAAIADLRGRIARSERPSESVLFAYYSGHGSERDLHLAGARLPLSELAATSRRASAPRGRVTPNRSRSGSNTKAVRVAA